MRLRALVLLLVLVAAPPAVAAPTSGDAGTTGTVTGRVLDSATDAPLPGATVLVDGTALLASTDGAGMFVLAGVPAGPQHLIVSYLGRKDLDSPVVVRPGAVTTMETVRLDKFAYSETVTVTAESVRDADARALNQQKTAPNIVNVASADQIGSFPDPNAAETAQRIPGVSIQRDQGEGRYVIVRGTEPRLNAMTIDGERIPAPDPLLRQVALDVVPSDLLEAIEVSKALTPDMDADSIGGTVNLVMKRAPDHLRFFGRAGSGYNQKLDSYGQNQYALSGGRRFDGSRMGVIGSFAGSTTNRGNEDVEVTYSAGNLADLDPRWYEVERRRIGATGAVDFSAGPSAAYTLRGVFNRFIDDHEQRQRYRNRVLNRRIERERRDRTHIERIASLSFDGRHVLAGAELDYKLLGAYSDQYDPLTMTTVFRQSNVNFAPNVSPTSIDPNNVQANPLNEDIAASTFNSQLRATNFAKDRDLVGALNYRRPLTTGASTSFLKVGIKFRDKRKGRNRNENTYTSSTTLRLTDFLESATPDPFLDGRYKLAPYINQDLVANIPSLATMTITRNHARDAEEFDGTERTTGVYAMTEVYAGSRLLIVPGVRVEHTMADFVGRTVQFAPNGAWLGTTPAPATANYAIPLPSLHVRYSLMPETNLRVAFTRTLARPNYYDLVPYRAQDDAAATVALGNAELDPTRSWNFDVMGEHYFKSVGVVSAGVFYKRLQDYIYSYTSQETINGAPYTVTQPLNGDAATVRGAEVTFQNRFKFLPAPLDGLGFYANYTYSDSTAYFPAHPGKSTLPGQSKHVGNLAASYENFGFSGRVAMNFHGSYVDQVGATDLLDRYYDTHKQLDVTLSQKITRQFGLYFEGINLNDAKLRYFQGVPERVLQEEHYNWWANFGVRFDF